MSGHGKDLDGTLGAIFVGLSVCGALWGVSCSQAWHYYGTRANDRLWLRIMVAVVWVADTVHQILISMAFYDYAITNFANPAYLLTVPRTSAAQVVLTQIVMLLVQSFYAYKIWRLSEAQYKMVVPVVLLTIAETGVAILDAVENYQSRTWAQLLPSTWPYSISYGVIAAADDIAITTLMCYLLYRNKTEYRRTNGVINRIMAFTLSTNLLTALCSVAILAMVAAYPDHIYFVPLFHSITRLYTNSFMAALNLRPYLTHGRSDPNPQVQFALSSFRVREFSTSAFGTTQDHGGHRDHDRDIDQDIDRLRDREDELPNSATLLKVGLKTPEPSILPPDSWSAPPYNPARGSLERESRIGMAV